ncbi:alpha/beta hydrolase [Candidatus Heimdallarchaeota archaeon B3_Heim]|nr:MAG: alpha/beta hydrolase [Candidatus Heimdallarchaeota archaeon B3_Heim]
MTIPYSGEKIARANNLEICYDTFGEETNPAILLIMGLGEQMITWEEVFCKELASHDYFVIRFDNRDVGLSTKFEDAPVPDIFALMQGEPVETPYQLIDMAKDATGLLDTLKIRHAHVCGVSMGGMIAQTIAIEFPDRIRSLISIMSHTGNPDLPLSTPEASAALIAPPEPERTARIEQGVEMWRIFDGGILSFDEDSIRKRLARSYDRSFYPLGTVRQLAAIFTSGRRTEALKSIKIPSLVIHGDADPLVPIEGGRDTADSIPGAKFVSIDGMGHNISPALAPQIISEILDHIKHT